MKLCPEYASQLYARQFLRTPGDGLLCPSQNWLDHIAPLIVQNAAASSLTLLNAGANKGFTAALLLQRFGDANFTNADWYSWLQRHLRDRHFIGTTHLCGVCCACVEPRPSPVRRRGMRVQVHAFEPVKKNYDFLVSAFARYSTPSASASIMRAAVGNQRNRSAKIMDIRVAVGKENVPASLVAADYVPRGFASVPIIVLDDWIRQQGVTRVDLALFDAEGWDYSILDGLRETLEAGRLIVFEFEAVWRPSAGPPFLNDTLSWLHRLNYECFFEYDNGCLAPASKPCQPPEIVMKRGIQNLVCACSACSVNAAALLWRLSNKCASSAELTNASPNRSWVPTKTCFAKNALAGSASGLKM